LHTQRPGTGFQLSAERTIAQIYQGELFPVGQALNGEKHVHGRFLRNQLAGKQDCHRIGRQTQLTPQVCLAAQVPIGLRKKKLVIDGVRNKKDAFIFHAKILIELAVVATNGEKACHASKQVFQQQPLERPLPPRHNLDQVRLSPHKYRHTCAASSMENAARCSSWPSIWAMGRRARSVTAERWLVLGRDRMCSWISGARRRRPMTWVTRARVVPSRRAISAWPGVSPESIIRRHSWALRSSSTILGGRGSRGGRGLPLGAGTVRKTCSAGTRWVILPMFPFSKAPSGPSETSTVCSRYAALSLLRSKAACTMRK